MKRKESETQEFPVLSEEQKDRCLDFAERMIFKGYENLTDKRKGKLWGDVYWFLRDALDEGHIGWESGCPDNTFSMADWCDERFDRERFPSNRWEHKVCELGQEPKYYTMLSATCRAAMDIISDFPGGVAGWTVGDIKRMYDGKLPEWFPTEGWEILGNGPATITDDDSKVLMI